MNVVHKARERSSSIRFVPGADGTLSAIEIESSLGRSALADVHWALHTLHIEIVHSVVRVKGERLLESIYVAERDGSSVTRERQLTIQRELIPLICEAPDAESGHFRVAPVAREEEVEALESGSFPIRRAEALPLEEDEREIA